MEILPPLQCKTIITQQAKGCRMIIEDQNMSDCLATYGDRSRRDREDSLPSSRSGIRPPVSSNHHHSFLTPAKIDISENFENLQPAGDADELRPRSVLVSLDRSGQVETEQ